jgi:membrane-bound lytic murein transglycosylase D
MKRLVLIVGAVGLIQFTNAATPSTHRLTRVSGTGECCILIPGDAQDSAGVKAAVVKPANTGIYHNNIYKKRLDLIQKEVQLDYNEYVQAEIDNYLTEKSDISRALGLAKYYFPIYEKAFREAGIPEEIKYLSVVESQLNPSAVSRMGAAGPWQFMPSVGRTYGLAQDEFVDERRDPVQSSLAAAAYLKDAYQQFGDWLLAIAAYNCGKSDVIRAIDQAGSSDFWAIRQYLPAQTRDYVPLYIAMTYVMNYYKEHNITPQQCPITTKTDTVSVEKLISLNSVAKTLSLNLSQLILLNPSYPRMLVNGSPSAPKTIVIPEDAKAKFTQFYGQMNDDLTATDLETIYNNEGIQPVEKRIPVHHRVRKFENLASIQVVSITKTIKG